MSLVLEETCNIVLNLTWLKFSIVKYLFEKNLERYWFCSTLCILIFFSPAPGRGRKVRFWHKKMPRIAGNLLPLEGSPCLMPRYSPGMGVQGFPLTSALRRAAHLSACTANSKLCTSYPEFEQKFQNPGEKVIASCIAGNYLKKEHLYTKRMIVSNDCWKVAKLWPYV